MKDHTTEEELDDLLEDHPEEVVNDEEVETVAEAATPTPVEEPSKHTVKSGETLYRIAQAYETSVESLKFLNGISNANLIRPGRELYVRWVVSEGQTLHNIADAYNASRLTYTRTNATSLATRSGIEDPDKIQVGQLVRLP